MINSEDTPPTSLSQIFHHNNEMNLNNSERLTLLEFFPQGLVALDLETTGLSPLVDRIIEIGAFKITKEGSFVFTTLIDPQIPIPAHTTAIHNITDDMIVNAPKLIDILAEFKDFLGDLPIVAHNAKFDLGFIVMGLRREKITLPSSLIYCSCKISRATHKEMTNHKLATLVKELNIPLVNHHRALDDAYAALKIFIHSLERLKKETSEEVLLAGLKTHGLLFSLDQFKELTNDELPPHLEKLNILVKEAAVIEIHYKGGSHKLDFRPVKLTSLLNTPDGNILYARCLLSGIYKSFKLNKILALRYPSAHQIQQWLLK